jgi:hypothetical protein
MDKIRENGINVGNEMLAFAFIRSAIAGGGIQQRSVPEVWKQ